MEGTRGMNTAVAAMDEAVAAMRLSRVGERESYPPVSCFDFFVDYSRSVGSGFVHYRIIPIPCWLDYSECLIGEFDTWKNKAFSLEDSLSGNPRMRSLFLPKQNDLLHLPHRLEPY